MSETAAFDAAVETVELPAAPTIGFCGEQIAVRPLPTIALLKFSKMASRGIGTSDVAGMAAMYDLIAGVVVPEALERFEQLAAENDINGTQLLEFVKEVIASNAGRPTLPPSSSQESASDGSPKSKSGLVVDFGDGPVTTVQPGETVAAAEARAMRMVMDAELDGIEQATDRLVAAELTE